MKNLFGENMEFCPMSIRLPKAVAQKVVDLSKKKQKSINQTVITLLEVALNDLSGSTHTELTKQSPGSKSDDSL